ncbi:hypothetical protein U1Q18_051812 [Sarracenia purpurea var. burkii]
MYLCHDSPNRAVAPTPQTKPTQLETDLPQLGSPPLQPITHLQHISVDYSTSAMMEIWTLPNVPTPILRTRRLRNRRGNRPGHGLGALFDVHCNSKSVQRLRHQQRRVTKKKAWIMVNTKVTDRSINDEELAIAASKRSCIC